MWQYSANFQIKRKSAVPIPSHSARDTDPSLSHSIAADTLATAAVAY